MKYKLISPIVDYNRSSLYLANSMNLYGFEDADNEKYNDFDSMINILANAIESHDLMFIITREADYAKALSALTKALNLSMDAKHYMENYLNALSENPNTIKRLSPPKEIYPFNLPDIYKSGIAFNKNKQHIALIPEGNSIIKNLFDDPLSKYLSENNIIFCETHTLGFSDIEKEDIDRFLILFKIPKGCKVIVCQIGGEILVIITAENVSKNVAKQLCDYTSDKILGQFSAYSYGVDMPSLPYLTVQHLINSNRVCALAFNKAANVIKGIMKSIPDSSDVFIFSGYDSRKESESEKEYSQKLAKGAKIETGADFGAAITETFKSVRHGQEVGYVWVSLTDGDVAFSESIEAHSYFKEDDIVDKAITKLFRMLLKID